MSNFGLISVAKFELVFKNSFFGLFKFQLESDTVNIQYQSYSPFIKYNIKFKRFFNKNKLKTSTVVALNMASLS
jgi:hypothetical protein